MLPAKHYGRPVSLLINDAGPKEAGPRSSRLTRPQLDKWSLAPVTSSRNGEMFLSNVNTNLRDYGTSNMYFDEKTGRFVEFEDYKGKEPKATLSKQHWYYDHAVPADMRGVTPAATIWEHELFRDHKP